MQVKQENKQLNGENLKIAIILATFNKKLGEELLKNTQEELIKQKVKKENILIEKVPGSLEIPITAKLIAQTNKYDAIITLGIVIKGSTYHFELVSNESHRAIMDTSLQEITPIIFGILTTYTKEQAEERIQQNKLNKGKEFAQTAIQMALLKNKYTKK